MGKKKEDLPILRSPPNCVTSPTMRLMRSCRKLRIPLSSHRLPTWTQKRHREVVLQHKIRFVQAWIEEEEQNL